MVINNLDVLFQTMNNSFPLDPTLFLNLTISSSRLFHLFGGKHFRRGWTCMLLSNLWVYTCRLWI